MSLCHYRTQKAFPLIVPQISEIGFRFLHIIITGLNRLQGKFNCGLVYLTWDFFFLKVYPKVKVRDQQEEDDKYAYGLGSLPSLKAFDALSISDLSSPDDSPTSVVRIPRSYISSSAKPATPVSTGVANNESKTKPRASSVPRPRAVLSSPVNDQMIGTGNKSRGKLLPGLKSQNVCQNRHTQCKIIPRMTKGESAVNAKEFKESDQCKIIPRMKKGESPLNAKEFKDSDHGGTGLQLKGRLARTDPSQKTHIRKGPASARSKVLGYSTVAE